MPNEEPQVKKTVAQKVALYCEKFFKYAVLMVGGYIVIWPFLIPIRLMLIIIADYRPRLPDYLLACALIGLFILLPFYMVSNLINGKLNPDDCF